jgi:predicted nucleic acid-binding protein
MIFVDTGAWFAASVPNDPDHAAADEWLATNTEPRITTDYILNELLTLLKIRNEYDRAILFPISYFLFPSPL